MSPRDRAAGLRLAVVVSDLHIDRRVLLYALGLSVLTGLSWVRRQPYRLRAGDPNGPTIVS